VTAGAPRHSKITGIRNKDFQSSLAILTFGVPKFRDEVQDAGPDSDHPPGPSMRPVPPVSPLPPAACGNGAPGCGPGLDNAILATGDGRLKHQLQADMAVQKKRPDHHDLGIHAPL
jgi:hypothetical protein